MPMGTVDGSYSVCIGTVRWIRQRAPQCTAEAALRIPVMKEHCLFYKPDDFLPRVGLM